MADEKTPDRASEHEELLIKEKEAERMEKYLKDGAYVIALAIDGRQLDSVELSEKLAQLGTAGTSHIIFVIGGSLGLSDHKEGRLPAQFFKDDLSPSVDEGNLIRADIPWIPHHEP